MKSFFIKFNFMWLGSLFFLLFFIAAIQHSARFSPSDALIWSTKYLDGITVGIVAMGLLLLSVLSWCYALWRNWKLTKSDKLAIRPCFGVHSLLIVAPIPSFCLVAWVDDLSLA